MLTFLTLRSKLSSCISKLRAGYTSTSCVQFDLAVAGC